MRYLELVDSYRNGGYDGVIMEYEMPSWRFDKNDQMQY